VAQAVKVSCFLLVLEHRNYGTAYTFIKNFRKIISEIFNNALDLRSFVVVVTALYFGVLKLLLKLVIIFKL
jgi:hypothetical protein